MMAKNMLSRTKNTKKTYVMKKIGPRTRLAASRAWKSKSPRMIRNNVKLNRRKKCHASFPRSQKKPSKISKRDKCTASRVECYIKLCVHSRVVFCFSMNQLCARDPARVSWKCTRELSFHATDVTYMASSKVLKSRT